MKKILPFILIHLSIFCHSQSFYYGADLSYINEMEDCGVVYQENNEPKDPYQIFADHGCNLVRLRLWHTPNWYDNLNSGQRYSDFEDVKRSMQRAKAAEMEVLLDFHLSDDWADPSKQVVPAAWASVVDDLEVLKDSLYNYIHHTLSELHQEDLLPKMVQIGNETNKGILLSQTVNDAGWTLDWNRNSELFNAAIQAVRTVEATANQSIEVAIHIAKPSDVDWFIENFIANSVTDFDVIGISYYDEWHNNTNIAQVGNIVGQLKADYNKEVMIFEAGYPWTTGWTDSANNILTSANTTYSPLSSTNQKQWLLDLTQAVKNNGGKGVIYWEPAWVSSSCSTQWGQGSHYENATFFDFENNLILDGGIQWMEENIVQVSNVDNKKDFNLTLSDNHQVLRIKIETDVKVDSLNLQLFTTDGKLVWSKIMDDGQAFSSLSLPQLSAGVYLVHILENGRQVWSDKVGIFQRH